MSEVPPLIDIHCHPLPNLDDGAASWDEALAMARLAAEDGVGRIIATPHQLGAFGHIHADAIRKQAAEFQQTLDRHAVTLTVLPGAEIRVEPHLAARVRRGELLTLANRGRHVLLELPHNVYFPIDRVLAELKAAGLTGILAHPERNQAIRSRPEVLAALVHAGCLVQVTGGSILGAFGHEVEQFASRLVEQGMVHFVATDAHGSRTRRPLLAKVFHAVANLVDESTAMVLLSQNPGRVTEGKEVPSGRRASRQLGPKGWFSSRKAG